MNLDYLKDALPNNWGQPLVPESFAKDPIRGVVKTVDGRVIDEAMRFTNYNVSNNLSDSHQLWAGTTLHWQANDAISVRDNVYHFDAKRKWQNAEQYVASIRRPIP